MNSYRRSIFIGGGISAVVLFVSVVTLYFSLGPCPSGTFACDNFTKCLPQRQFCDNQLDCRDRTDEDRVKCGMYYGAKKAVTAIMNDALKAGLNDSHKNDDDSNRELKNKCVIKTYPEKICECRNGKMLQCNHNQIPQLSSEVTHLLLIGVNLTLEHNSLQGLNLSYINFKNSSISKIPLGIFTNQTYLHTLILGYNYIEILENGLFKGLNKLERLLMGSNRLHTLNLEILKALPSITILNLTDNQLTLNDSFFPQLTMLTDLYLDINCIEEIEDITFSELTTLDLLSLTNNSIKFIHSKAFWKLVSLTDLRLSDNPIALIADETFSKVTNLDALYLANTNLNITKELLASLNLSYLNIDGVNENAIDFDALQIPNLKYVVFKSFYFCTMIPHVKRCEPNTDGISSYEDLLMKPILRYSTWSMALITIIGNILVLYGRHIFRDENHGVTMVIRNLAVADILMGFYLIVIGIQDLRYRNQYHQYAREWISSWSCAAAGVIAVTSSEVSILILSFMSLERFLLIANPFSGLGRLNKKNISIFLILIWLLGGCIAISPVIMWHSSTRFYGTYSGTCFPLHIQERYPLGWKYSAFIFLGLNLFLLIMIAILYTALLLSICRTRRATPLAILDCEFAIRFFFIVLTDLACWAPIIFMKIWTFLNYHVSDDTYAWLVVFVLPLNSAVNPMLYTFTTPKYRTQVWLRGWHKITSKRKTIMDGSRESNPTASNQAINNSSSIKVFTT